VDIVQGLSPRSTVTVAGGYDFTNYLNKSSAQFPIINSQQTTAQAGYNHLLSRKDQIGVQYAFQEFHFPRAGSGSVNAHVWHALYGHRVTGRLNFTIAGGPQLLIVIIRRSALAASLSKYLRHDRFRETVQSCFRIPFLPAPTRK